MERGGGLGVAVLRSDSGAAATRARSAHGAGGGCYQDKLEGSEVLGAHIYTGANFAPLNAICRNLLQSILDLLKGDKQTPDNKMCTTRFCISSCLKKLSQKTELPETRCSLDTAVTFERALTRTRDRYRHFSLPLFPPA